jgi:hypothetical protein
MAGPAEEARQLVDQRTVQLAKLHWALQSHSTRVEVAMRWLDAVEVPIRAAAAPVPASREPVAAPAAGHEQVVLAPEDPHAPDSASRRLRVIVSESREVSLEVEDKIPAPAPELGTRYRLAS